MNPTLTATGRSSVDSSQSRSRSATKSVVMVLQANSAFVAAAMSPMSQHSRKSMLNASQTERSLQLKVANDRLVQLEKMYEELSMLEVRAAGGQKAAIK